MSEVLRHAMSDTTIIIPQRGHAELTRECLATLRQQERVPWPVVVVDDGTPQAAAELHVEEYFPAQVCRQPRRGVSAAWNRGAQLAETPFLVFLNNDTRTGGPWVDELVRPLRRGECVMAGVGTRYERGLPTGLLEELPVRTFLQGWCFAIAEAVFCRLGGFDNSLRVYWSDTDLQLRAVNSADGNQRQLLREVAGLPLVHLGHRTAHDRRYLAHQREQWRADRARFVRKWQRHTVR